MYKTILTLLLSSVLVACSSDSDDGTVSNNENPTQESITYPVDSPTLAQIAGIYDASYEEYTGDIDITYTQIHSDGRTSFYDYDGDDFDQGEDCYVISHRELGDNSFEDLGNGKFYASSEEEGDEVWYDATLPDQNTLKLFTTKFIVNFSSELRFEFEYATENDLRVVSIQLFYNSYTSNVKYEYVADAWSLVSENIATQHENIFSNFDIDDLDPNGGIRTLTRYDGTISDFTPECASTESFSFPKNVSK